ncbi:hypothetical protein [Marivita sp. GX14005]|uniref:hypothetical protein n=1 Tax=Marivita sp. GX14005 TaxID=2942276 RepID=UPI002018857F|nr:hypothetical protein [Marivita sp. GX14005]MCL3883319.1 hypothetical protein [Marivita sp. GX14005]
MIPPRIGGPSGPPPPGSPPGPGSDKAARLRELAGATDLSAISMRTGAKGDAVGPQMPDAARLSRLQNGGPTSLKEALGTRVVEVQAQRAEAFAARVKDALAALPGPTGRVVHLDFDKSAPLSLHGVTAGLSLATETRAPLQGDAPSLAAGFAALDAADGIDADPRARIVPDASGTTGARHAAALGALIGTGAPLVETIRIEGSGPDMVAVRTGLSGRIDLAATLARRD